MNQTKRRSNIPVLEDRKRRRLLKTASYLAVAVAILLISIKLSAWLYTDSVAVLGSLIDSVVDAVVSLMNLVAIGYAMQPADNEHRFGHGKAESIAGLVQGLFIAGSAILLVVHALDSVTQEKVVEHTAVGIYVMLVSTGLTVGLVLFQRYVVRKTSSTAVEADAWHYLSDILINGGVIAALLLAQAGYPGFDGYFAMAIAAYIFYVAWRIFVAAAQGLLDRELGPEVWRVLDEIIKNNPDVKGYHALRTRQAGHVKFIQVHIDLDKDMPLLRAHAISDEIESAILQVFPNADVLIHTDPK